MDCSLEVFSDLVEELEGVQPLIARRVRGAALDAQGQVLRHVAILDGLDDDALKGLREVGKLGMIVKLGAL